MLADLSDACWLMAAAFCWRQACLQHWLKAYNHAHTTMRADRTTAITLFPHSMRAADLTQPEQTR